jgi:hypothetical protein
MNSYWETFIIPIASMLLAGLLDNIRGYARKYLRKNRLSDKFFNFIHGYVKCGN